MIKKILLLLSFISVLSGCGTLTKYRYLSKDSMDTGNGYSSVVVWDLNITAAAYERISYSGRPYFKMTLGGDEISDREATWVSSPDGFSTYHARYIVETKMDILDPWSIEIPINGFGILSIKPKHPLEIKSDSITYAGTYNVEIKGYELDNTGFSTIFNYAHNRDSESLDVVKQWVAQEYPRVYSHLKRQVFSASEYILYEDFEGLNSIHQSYTKWPDLQTEGFSALRSQQIKDNYLIFKSFQDRQYSYGAPLDWGPGNFDITFDSTWVSGIDNQGYGLLFGKSDQNFYSFMLTGDGKVSTFWKNNKDKSGVSLIPWQNGCYAGNDGMITNSYLIQYRDGKYSCIVNGQLIGDFENQIPMNQGYIGFVINGKQAVHFDNIKILYLGI